MHMASFRCSNVCHDVSTGFSCVVAGYTRLHSSCAQAGATELECVACFIGAVLALYVSFIS